MRKRLILLIGLAFGGLLGGLLPNGKIYAKESNIIKVSKAAYLPSGEPSLRVPFHPVSGGGFNSGNIVKGGEMPSQSNETGGNYTYDYMFPKTGTKTATIDVVAPSGYYILVQNWQVSRGSNNMVGANEGIFINDDKIKVIGSVQGGAEGPTKFHLGLSYGAETKDRNVETINFIVSPHKPNVVYATGTEAATYDMEMADTGRPYKTPSEVLKEYKERSGNGGVPWTEKYDETNGGKIVAHKEKGSKDNTYNKIKESLWAFNKTFKVGINFFYAIAIFTSMIALIVNAVKLALSGSFPMQRRTAIVDLITSFICVALLGSITLFTKLVLEMTMT